MMKTEVKRKRGRPKAKVSLRSFYEKSAVITRFNGCHKVLSSEEIRILREIKLREKKTVERKIEFLKKMLDNDDIPEIYKLNLEERIEILENIEKHLEAKYLEFEDLARKIKNYELPLHIMYYPNPLKI